MNWNTKHTWKIPTVYPQQVLASIFPGGDEIFN